MMAAPCTKSPGVWTLIAALLGLQTLAGCGARHPQVVANKPQGASNEIAMLQEQIQQTEHSSMPQQVKQHVEYSLNAQIQAIQRTSKGQQ